VRLASVTYTVGGAHGKKPGNILMSLYCLNLLRARYVLGALLAAALATTAVAHADSQDDQFVALVSAQGIPGAPEQWIAAGRAACHNYGSYTLLAEQYNLTERGLSQDQAYNVIWDGIKAYCPEKAGGMRLP
jgi:hypothetical protein